MISFEMGFARQFFFFAVLLCTAVMNSIAESFQERLIESVACMQQGWPCVEHTDCCGRMCISMFCAQ
uniref:Venom peptide U3-SYTX-Sth1e n=1 Tax=Scytodes thoracica TaxID=1112478 RepID=A0A0A0V9U6_SCYTH|nr:venom peptide U3-SYTX-Sth1e [Scytodes thoracica]